MREGFRAQSADSGHAQVGSALSTTVQVQQQTLTQPGSRVSAAACTWTAQQHHSPSTPLSLSVTQPCARTRWITWPIALPGNWLAFALAQRAR